jgi:phosphatidylinositol-3-phosphatase
MFEKAALSAAATAAASAHAVQTVFVIALENHNFTQPSTYTSLQQLFGNPAAPYLNSLITPGNANAAMTSYASNYNNVPSQLAGSPSGAGAVHPSEPNYIWAEAGQTAPNGVRTDGDPSAANNNILPAGIPSLSAELQTRFGASGWKSYQEDSQLNSSGTVKSTYTVPLASVSGANGPANAYNGSTQFDYAVKHDPQAFFSATDGAGSVSHYAPLQQLQTDLNNNSVAKYNWITPDQFNDMHTSLTGGFTYNGTHFTGDAANIAQGDNFLSIIVPMIEASAAFQNNGVIVIWNDETEGGDTSAFTGTEIVISPLAKGNAFNSTLSYNHSSDLKTWSELFGVNAPGDAANPLVNDLSDLFQPDAIPTTPVLVNDHPLAVTFNGTATITPDLLSASDPDNSHAQLAYTVVTGPSHGTLLKNGSATSSFTQDDIDNNRITFHDDGQVVSSDSFTFNVSDPAGNHTADTQFQIQISQPDVVISALPNRMGYSTLGTGDFNHDGFSDVVLQNNASGKMEIWYMANGQIIGDYPYGNLSGYKLLGTGDFNGDGTSDIVWQSIYTGQAEIWSMRDGAVFADTPIGNLSGYSLIGTGDFTGGGTTGMVWQNNYTGQAEIWVMSNNHLVADVSIGDLSGYNLIGTADLNHDHQTDLIWQSKSTGKVDVWFMGNGHVIADYDYGDLSGYKLLATGDINHDGTNDLLWQNKATGEVSDWIIGPQTGVASSFQSFGIQPLNFQETASGVNPDGSPDVLWQDPATGQTQMWNVSHHDVLMV